MGKSLQAGDTFLDYKNIFFGYKKKYTFEWRCKKIVLDSVGKQKLHQD